MALSLEDGNDLPYLLTLVHNCTEKGNSIAHGLCPLKIALHHRVTVRMTARPHLYQ